MSCPADSSPTQPDKDIGAPSFCVDLSLCGEGDLASGSRKGDRICGATLSGQFPELGPHRGPLAELIAVAQETMFRQVMDISGCPPPYFLLYSPKLYGTVKTPFPPDEFKVLLLMALHVGGHSLNPN